MRRRAGEVGRELEVALRFERTADRELFRRDAIVVRLRARDREDVVVRQRLHLIRAGEHRAGDVAVAQEGQADEEVQLEVVVVLRAEAFRIQPGAIVGAPFEREVRGRATAVARDRNLTDDERAFEVRDRCGMSRVERARLRFGGDIERALFMIVATLIRHAGQRAELSG